MGSVGTVAAPQKALCLSNAPYLRGEGFSLEGELGNLTVGKVYEARVEGEWIRVWDDYDEDYLYPLGMFQVMETDR